MSKPPKKATAPKVQKEVPLEPFHFKGKNFNLYFVLGVIAFCFIIYGNNIRNGFSLDDEFVLHGDTVVQQGVKAIPRLFKMRYAWDQKGNYGYRPLVKVSFALESQFFGRGPHIGHIINNLMYAALCIFLFYFLRKLFYNEVSDYFLLVVTAIFICHPMHTEVVDSLKNRDILMVCLFGFFSTYAFVKAFETQDNVKKVLWILSGILAFDLGLLSKPDEYLFIGITSLVVFFYFWRNDKLSILPAELPAILRAFLSAFIVIVLILIGRVAMGRIIHNVLPHSAYHRTFIFIEQPLLYTQWYQRISLGFSAIWFYISKLIFPIEMICYYGYDKIHPHPAWSDINVILGLVLAATWVYLVFRNRRNRGITMFTLLFLGGTLFAYTDIVEVGPGIFADRFTFIPSLGFALAVALLIFYLFKLSFKARPMGIAAQYLYTIIGLICVAYSARTIVRNPDWYSHLSVYRHDVKLAKRSAKLQSLTAAACVQEIQENKNLTNDERVQLYKEAEEEYLASIEVYPEYTTSLNNEGMIQYNFYRNLPKAIEYFNRAISYDPDYTEALFNKGAAYEALGKKDSAEVYFKKAIKSNPEYYLTYVYLARLYFGQGKFDKIIEFNQDAIDHGHVSDVVYVNIGNVYLAMKDTVKAVDYFQKAVAAFNKNIYLEDFLTKYFATRDPAKSAYYAKVAAEARKQRAMAMGRQE